MKGFKKGLDNAMPLIMLISVLLMNILLITGLMKMFFGWDSTILAGVIAFIGAVIGGTITLIGVNKTIQEGRRKEELESALLKLKYANLLTKKLSNLQKDLPFEEPDFKSNIKLFSMLHEGVSEIATSTEALVLGKEVTNSIDSLGRTVVQGRIDSMVNKVPDYDDLLLDINKKFINCYTAINHEMDEITLKYHSL